MKLVIYKDRDLISNVKDSLLVAEIKKRGFYEDVKHQKINFCGVIAINDQVNVFVPRASVIDSTNSNSNVLLAANTLKAMDSYNNNKRLLEKMDDDLDGAIGLSNLSNIKQLMNDYVQYGLYFRTKKTHVKNSSRPDWKQTIKNSFLLPSKSNKFIYLDLISMKRSVNSATLISLIHANIIKEIDENYSWLITGRLGRIASNLKSVPKIPINARLKKYYLNLELSQTYSEREIVLIRLLIDYLDENYGDKKNTFIAGVKKFHFVWEHMLRSVLDNQISISKQLPKTSYIDSKGLIVSAPDRNMRTDIIIEDTSKKIRAVVDAKYYESKSANDAPGWADMVKQFFYAKALKSLSSKFIIKNVFVFPGNTQYLQIAKMQNVTGNTDLDLDFPPITCLYISPNEILYHFVKRKKMHLLRSDILNS